MQRGSRILRSKRTLLASLVVIGTALGALTVATSSVAAQDSAAASRPTVLPGSAAPKAPEGTARVGALAAGHQLSVEVTLNLRNQAGLTALLGGLANPSSPYYHDFLTPAQFTADFGPTDAQVAQVESALRAAGLTPGLVSSDHLSIPVTASAARLDHAFGITLATYREPGGRAAYANTTAPEVAASIAPLVQGVLGLNDLYQAHDFAVPAPDTAAGRQAVVHSLAASGAALPATAAVGPQPTCSGAIPTSTNTAGLPENYFAQYYGLTQLYSLGDEGAGQKIALLELEPNSTTDIKAFQSCFGLTNTVNYTTVDPGVGTGSGSGEAALDIELAAVFAPKATIDVYQAPNSNGMGPGTGVYDIVHAFAAGDTEKTLSTSWGTCETESTLSDLQAQETLFQEANAHGQTILAAAGDSGATGCFLIDGNKTVSAGFPASAPYVVGVGGTAIVPFTASAFSSTSFSSWGQIVWNESNPFDDPSLGIPPGGAGGGGTSGWCMPSYQDKAAIPGLINSFTPVAPPSACIAGTSAYPDTTSFFRETPDVSANADPYWNPYDVYFNGSWTGFGGTSAAAPLWAAIAALTDASPFCSGYGSGAAGVLPQALYAAVAANAGYVYGSQPEALADITPVPEIYDPFTQGQMAVPANNDYTPSGDTSGDYPVTKEYDLATGLGTPLVGGLSGGKANTYAPGYTALICRQLSTKHLAVTGVSPSSGKANTATKVTIKGTGFLTVAGAVHVRVYQGTAYKVLTASCTSTTACTVTLPALSAQTVDLRVSVEDSAYTSAVAADRYTYANAPHISSYAPSSGTHLGGTKVTIHGSNFIGVKSVTFGGKAGTGLTVSGTTTLTVNTPAGTRGAKVTVVVNAAGGTSNTVSYTFT